MRATLFALCIALLPGLARADLGDARRILATSCARCHTAQPGGAGAKSAEGAPDLVALVKQKSSAEILTWLQGPSKVNPETACDVSGLDLRFANDLVNYLVGLTVVPPARPAAERR
jgi:cytochrome c